MEEQQTFNATINTTMIISELFNPAPQGYYDEHADNTTIKKTDSRKTRLTLAHLNQLRQSHDIRKLEHEQKLEVISKQYSQATAEPALGGLGI